MDTQLGAGFLFARFMNRNLDFCEVTKVFRQRFIATFSNCVERHSTIDIFS